jgi:hypothetical protein
MATLAAVLQNGKHIFVIGESPIYRRRGDHGDCRQKGQYVSTSHEPEPLSPDRHDDDQAAGVLAIHQPEYLSPYYL